MYSGINEALQSVEKQARPRLSGSLPHVANAALAPTLSSPNSQVILGREGAGKTHLLLGLENELEDSGYLCAFVDLSTAGSAEDLYVATARSEDLPIRATSLAIDALAEIHDALRIRILDREEMDSSAANYLDSLLEAITRVRVAGEEERSHKLDSQHSHETAGGLSLEMAPQALMRGSISRSTKTGDAEARSTLIVRKGHADVWLHLRWVRQAFEGLATRGSGLVILLDEWDSVPPALQPWLADLVRRLLWDTPGCVVKIAASKPPLLAQTLPEGVVGLKSEQRSTIDLDNPAVNDQEGQGLLLRILREHVSHAIPRVASPEDCPSDPDQFIAKVFSSHEAAEALVAAAENNPRDALTIGDKAAQLAGRGPLDSSHVMAAARWLVVSRKLSGLEMVPGIERWLIEHVLNAGSRTFYVPMAAGTIPTVLAGMYERRLLHPDGPTISGLPPDELQLFGEWHVDFGFALHLLRATSASIEEVNVPLPGGYEQPVDVPRFELRVIEKIAAEPVDPPSLSAEMSTKTNNASVDSAIEALPATGVFLVIDNEGLVKTVQVVDSPSFLGRSFVHANIAIEDETVSRRHAELTKVAGRWQVSDCNSTNGLTLNGRQVAQADLRSFDVIGLGTAKAYFINRSTD